MSRIGIKPVVIPSGVNISIDGRLLNISGPLGSLSLELHSTILCQVDGQILSLQPIDKNYCNRKFWGLYRSLINNAVHGVSVGFVVKVKINGVGYKASLNKNLLFISLGFSHTVCIEVPNDLSITIEEPTLFFIKGIDKQSITTMADRIKMLRFPEPYKGKGIILNDEFVFRKEGKR